MCQVVNLIVFLVKIIYEDIFRLSGYKDINERLNDSMYEVLDVLSVYVFGHKLEHKNGDHMINFDPNAEKLEDSDQQEAIKKIQKVN